MKAAREVPLRYLAECLDGRRIPLNQAERYDIPGNVPYWGSGGVVGTVGTHLFDEPLVLLGEDGAPFYDRDRDVAFKVSGKTWVNNHIHVLRPYSGVDQTYLTYALNDVDYSLYISGSTRDKLTQEDMRRISVPVWSLEQQRSIAHALDRETAQIDDLIGKQERLIELLGERRASLLDSIVSNAGNGWPNKPMKRLARITVGIVITPSVWYSDEGVLALRGVNIQPEAITLNDVVRLTPEGHAFHSKSELRTGDVVVVRTGQAGAAAVVPENLSGSNAIDLLIIRPDPGIDGEYLAMVVNSSTVQEHVRQHSVGAIQAHFNVGSLREVAVSIPPLAAQCKAAKEWRKKSTALDALSAKSIQLIARLRERRAALISAAVTGKINVQGEGVSA